MNMKLSLVTLGVALAVATPVAAQQQASARQQASSAQQNSARQQSSAQQQAAGQRKVNVTVSGKVLSRARVRTTENETREVVKLRTPSGSTLIADLGETGTQPQFRLGDRLIVSGRSARVNGKPVLLVSHAGVIERVGSAANTSGMRQARGAKQQPNAGEWVVLTFTPIAVVTEQDQQRESLFGKLDGNHDARIARNEAQGHPQIASNFDRIDRNGDGLIGWTEFSQLHVADAQQQQGTARSRSANGERSAARARYYERITFQLLDDDKDNMISHYEAQDLPALAHRFPMLDRDKNGDLSRAEIGPEVAAKIWGEDAKQASASAGR